MDVIQVYDYVEKQRMDCGLDIALIFEESENEDVDSKWVPTSFNQRKKNFRRIGVYVNWYTEYATLLLEKRGVGIKEMREILTALEKEGFNPYEFREISCRGPKDVEVREKDGEFIVIDKMREIYFSTENSNNPSDLNAFEKAKN